VKRTRSRAVIDRVAKAGLFGLSLAGMLIGVSAGQAQSVQTAPDASYTDLSQYLLPDNKGGAAPVGPAYPRIPIAPGGNFSAVDQTGVNNRATVDLNGVGDATRQTQVGFGNNSSLSVVGGQNTVTTSQVGNNDSTTISLSGQGNNVLNSQVGSNLSYGLQQIGNNKTVTVQQFGVK